MRAIRLSDRHANSLTNPNSYGNGLTEPNRDRYADGDSNGNSYSNA